MAAQTEAAGGITSTAREQAGAAWDGMKDSARAVADEQQRAAAKGIGEFAGALRQAAHNMDASEQTAVSRIATNVADGLERLSGTLRSRDVNSVVRDVESFARSQPLVFFGAAVAAGFLAVRFLKSQEPDSGQPAMGSLSGERCATGESSTSLT